MTEEEGRALVIAEARKWLKTPYHGCADVLGAGVDCGMLLVRAFVDCGLVAPFDPRPYTQDWHLHKDEEKYLGFVTSRLTRTETPKPGDVMIFRYGRCYSHGGLVTATDPLTMIHAFLTRQSVIEEPLWESPEFSDPTREPRFYTLWS
jgi:cell wall-associated NlpC family hydrolase